MMTAAAAATGCTPSTSTPASPRTTGPPPSSNGPAWPEAWAIAFNAAPTPSRERSGVRLSESTVERTTEDAGGRIAALLQQGVTFGPPVAWHGHADARGRAVAYGTL